MLTAFLILIAALSTASSYASPAETDELSDDVLMGSAVTIDQESSVLKDGRVGVNYNHQFNASGKREGWGIILDSNSMSWNISSGQLPPGLNLSKTGTLSYAPSKVNTANGKTPFPIRKPSPLEASMLARLTK